MNFRSKALDLYRKGKTIEEIQSIVGIPINIETLEKWDNENKQYNSIRDLIKTSKKLKNRLREKEKLTNSEKEVLNQKLKAVAAAILVKNPGNMIAKRDLFNSLYNLKELYEAESVGKQILEEDTENVVVLNKLANISARKKEYDKAIEYLEKVIRINPDNQNFKRKLEEFKQLAATTDRSLNIRIRIFFR